MTTWFSKNIVLSKIRPQLLRVLLTRDERRVKNQLDRTHIDGDMALSIITSNRVFLHHLLHFPDLKLKLNLFFKLDLLQSYPMNHFPQDPTNQDQDPKRMIFPSRPDVAVRPATKKRLFWTCLHHISR